MKIWNGYGSEHSMNLVMIGHFKSNNDAEKTKQAIDMLTEELTDKITLGSYSDKYDPEVFELLTKMNCSIINPQELEQFFYEVDTSVEQDKIILKTDETEVSAFFKLMIENGAKVEIYSAHSYPDTPYGRGK